MNFTLILFYFITLAYLLFHYVIHLNPLFYIIHFILYCDRWHYW